MPFVGWAPIRFEDVHRWLLQHVDAVVVAVHAHRARSHALEFLVARHRWPDGVGVPLSLARGRFTAEPLAPLVIGFRVQRVAQLCRELILDLVTIKRTDAMDDDNGALHPVRVFAYAAHFSARRSAFTSRNIARTQTRFMSLPVSRPEVESYALWSFPCFPHRQHARVGLRRGRARRYDAWTRVNAHSASAET